MTEDTKTVKYTEAWVKDPDFTWSQVRFYQDGTCEIVVSGLERPPVVEFVWDGKEGA